MNNRGFTLIELIATIVLLGVIAVISYVSINEVLKKSKISDCETLVNNIKSATKEYVSDNRYSNIFNDIYDTISIDAMALINGNYLSSPIINPFTSDEMDASSIIINIKMNSDYTVKEVTVGAPSILQTCNSE